jgi:hypothetical protein
MPPSANSSIPLTKLLSFEPTRHLNAKLRMFVDRVADLTGGALLA